MTAPVYSREFGVRKADAQMRYYVDAEIFLRLDYSDEEIYFRNDKLSIIYSELGSMCSIDQSCSKIANFSTFSDFPALTRFELPQEQNKTSTDITEFLDKHDDPSSIITKFSSGVETEVGILAQNKAEKYFITKPFISRRFGRLNNYSLLLKVRTKEATRFVKNLSLVISVPNPSYQMVEVLTRVALFFITLIVLICVSIELANRPYNEWMGFNKDLLQLVILQLLSSGAFGYIFELIESEYTSAIQFGEHILRTIQTAMNFAIYTNGYFYNKRNTGTNLPGLKTVGLFILSVCYIGEKILLLASQNLPSLTLMNDIAQIGHHYMYLLFSVFFIVVLALALSYWCSDSTNQEISYDNFTSLLVNFSFGSLVFFFAGFAAEEFSLTSNSGKKKALNRIVFFLYASQVNQNLLNLFLLYLSTPLNFEEESHLAELEESDRKEFGQELENTTRIDHLDTYEDSVVNSGLALPSQLNTDNQQEHDKENSNQEDSDSYDRDSYTDEEEEGNHPEKTGDQNYSNSGSDPQNQSNSLREQTRS